MNRFPVLLAALGLFFGGACSTSRQVYTQPPLPGVSTLPPSPPVERPLTLFLLPVADTLPDAVAAVRFRIDSVRVHRAESGWETLAVDAAPFDVSATVPSEPVVLSRRLPVSGFDSLAVRPSDVFLLFGTNAGGPLVVSEGYVTLAASEDMAESRSASLTLRFDLQASIARADSCRWVFEPRFSVARAPEGGQ